MAAVPTVNRSGMADATMPSKMSRFINLKLDSGRRCRETAAWGFGKQG